MTKEEAMKLALDRSEPSILSPGWTLVRDEDIAAMREALAEQPAQQDSTCSNALRAQGKAYPRTCKKCGLGPCVELAQQALDKKAENARELGLDYEPIQCPICKAEDSPYPKCGCVTYVEQPAQQEPVAPTAVEMQNAAANLALMREMWGNADEPAAKVNDEGFIVETGLLLSPGTKLYTSPQRTWVGLTDEERKLVRNSVGYNQFVTAGEYAEHVQKATEFKLLEKNT